MRLGLIHNDDAGSAGERSGLVAMIGRHGHDTVVIEAPEGGGALRLPDGLDAVVAAGGDGTIAAVALAMRGSPVPLAILPMGTANNIALSLGITRDADAAVDAWAASRAQPFDTGVATGPWGERPFVESVGGGLVTHGITVMDRRFFTSPSTAEQVQRALRSHLDVLDLLAPASWVCRLDGTPLGGEFLLLEVLNTAAIGPNLRFAPATPFDGHFTVVAAGPDDRAALAEYLRASIAGEAPGLRLPAWPAREVVIETSDRLHIDDTIADEPTPGMTAVRVAIQPGAVQVLTPRG